MKGAGIEPQPWRIWQLVDSAFPTGAFAHSWGLESAWRHGEVPDRESLRRFIDHSLVQTVGSVVPLMNAAYGSPDRIAELDTLADAFLLNEVANRASRALGRTFVASAARVWPTAEMTTLETRCRTLSFHAAPSIGIVTRTLGLSLETVQAFVLHSTLRGVTSAAVRLGLVGSYDAQRLQSECAPVLTAHLARCEGLTEHDLAQSTPILDLLQAGQDRLYTRLFQS
jgi:urease accessory protein